MNAFHRDVRPGTLCALATVVVLGIPVSASADIEFSRPTLLDLDGFPKLITAGDLNGDNAPDIVAVAFSPFGVFIAINDGAGGFDALVELDKTSVDTIGVGDLDGAGDLDIAGGNSGVSFVWVNDGAGAFQRVNVPIGGRLRVADLNGDNRDDLVIEHFKDEKRFILVYADFDGATFGEPIATEFTQGPIGPNALADVDGDGDLDFLFRPGFEIVLALNDGTGSFPDTVIADFPEGVFFGGKLAAGDVNGDDIPDIIGTGQEIPLVHVLPSIGLLAYGPLMEVTGGRGATFVADIDGDCDNDLIGAENDGSIAINENLDGLGMFSEIQSIPMTPAPTSAHVLADFDGDGDLDLATVGGILPSLVAIAMNLSTGAAMGDLNGDCVVGSSDLLQLLGNWGPCDQCAADLDGDGVVGPADLLILLGNWG